MTTMEVCARAGISVRTLRKYIQQGKIVARTQPQRNQGQIGRRKQIWDLKDLGAIIEVRDQKKNNLAAAAPQLWEKVYGAEDPDG